MPKKMSDSYYPGYKRHFQALLLNSILPLFWASSSWEKKGTPPPESNPWHDPSSPDPSPVSPDSWERMAGPSMRLNAKNIKGGLMISKILVPTDGSKAAQKAARYAVDLAKQLKASIIVLSVIDKRSFIGQTVPAAGTARHVIEPIEDYLREAAEGYAGEIKKLCDKNGVQPKTVITAGHPVEEIVKEAEKSKADLIVMGSHGRSALGATVLGSVAYGVIHKDTKIPALVVKR
jgi:nucleotide-binding universal stress UspA family protein